ncbi:MAG: toluene monooxygenase [Gammaproteobacteria bacterium]|nr:toluene monooxygenase [Gammaproteobacteria bacterium]
MTDSPLPTLKTWSYLSTGARRRPSEYEVVSTGLHYHTLDQNRPWELDPNIPMAQWYKRYRNQSPLRHPDWDAFRDPDEMIYRTYNLVQDGQENYVYGLFDQFNERGHDQLLDLEWVRFLADAYTPSRYLFHALQLGSAYVHQMAPASTITNCATYATADHLRWVTHTAYRTRELANAFPGLGFAECERERWETDPRWQGFRELVEQALVAWDWAEAFTAFFLIVKPAVEEAVLNQLGELARAHGDTLLGLLTQAQTRDAERHRRWGVALVTMALEQPGNREVLTGWLGKWVPLAEAAVEEFCAGFPSDGRAAAQRAKHAMASFRGSLLLAASHLTQPNLDQ